MKVQLSFIAFLASLLLAAQVVITPSAHACSQAPGHFHQVTLLRGTVVGVNSGDFRHMFPWLRHHAPRGNVALTLYEYRWPFNSRSELRAVKTIRSNEHGFFDFGALQEGHYTLAVETPWGYGDWYDVQVTKAAKRTAAVMIDVSPVYPDCSGGHQFLVTTD